MRVKKANALCTWLLGLVLTGHILTMSFSFLTGWFSVPVCLGFAAVTAALAAVHGILVLIIFFFQHDGAAFSKGSVEAKKTFIQRATAILILPVLHLHVKAFGFITAGTALSVPQKIFLLVTETLFFGCVLSHFSISFPRSMITMGLLGDDQAENKAANAARIVCGILLLLSVGSMTAFVIGWTGRG